MEDLEHLDSAARHLADALRCDLADAQALVAAVLVTAATRTQVVAAAVVDAGPAGWRSKIGQVAD